MVLIVLIASLTLTSGLAGIAVLCHYCISTSISPTHTTPVGPPCKQGCRKQPRTTNDTNKMSREILAEFVIDKKIDYMLLPVNIDGDKYKFILDTASNNIICDVSLKEKLGKFVKTWKNSYDIDLKSSTLDIYEAPEAFKVGQISVRGVVGCKDLKQLGIEKYKGIIGVNFLKNFIVQLDFAKSRIFFLKVPEEHNLPWGPPTDLISKHEPIIPYISATLACDYKVEFMIDTGLPGIGFLHEEIFQKLLLQNNVKLLYGKIELPSGVIPVRAIAAELSIGPLKYKDIRFFERRRSILGMDFLKQHSLVTFDFPRNRLHLKRHNPSDQIHKAPVDKSDNVR